MNINYAFKKMDSSDSIVDYVEGKVVNKIKQFSHNLHGIHFTFAKESFSFVIGCQIWIGRKNSIQLGASASDLYSAADLLNDKIEKTLKRKMEIYKDHKNKESIAVTQISHFQNRSRGDEWENSYVNAEDIIEFEKYKQRKAS